VHEDFMDDNGKKVNIISTGSLNAKSGKSGKSEKINIDGGDITLTGATKITLKVGSNKLVISNTGIAITGTKVDIKANTSAKLEGAMVDVKGQATVNVQSTGMTKVAGSLLKLN
ncbi:MAG: type IV secretion protein Rhs, partial [Cyanobacteria bacterium J06554_3]